MLLCSLLFLAFFSPSAAHAATAANLNVLLEGQPFTMQVPPIIVSDRTLIGVRAVGEAVGGSLVWDPDLRQVTINRLDDTIVLKVGESRALVNGQAVTMDVPAQIVNDRTMVPLRFIAEALGGGVEWNDATRTANILRKPTQITGFTYSNQPEKATLQLTFSEPLLSVTPSESGNVLSFDLYPAAVAVDQPVKVIDDPLARQIALEANGRHVRLRLDLKYLPTYHQSLSPDGKVLTVEFEHSLFGISARQTDQTFGINIATTGKVSYRTFTLQNPNRLVIDLANTHLASIVPSTLEVGNPLLTRVRIAQYQPDTVRLVLEMPAPLPPQVVATNWGFHFDFAAPLSGRRIWLDAGHGKIPGGANDPGTLGKTTGITEAQVNLKVALELQKLLQGAGAQVYMTRTGVEGVDYRDRPALVNAVDPAVDLFISIHHNSSTITTARGTETYYWTPQSQAAAEAIHAGVVSYLGFPDRRVRTDNFYVITYTKAPAILLELGYLSNPDEERLIADAAYPAKAAEAIKRGVFDYFLQEILRATAN